MRNIYKAQLWCRITVHITYYLLNLINAIISITQSFNRHFSLRTYLENAIIAVHDLDGAKWATGNVCVEGQQKVSDFI